jgi:NAD(P)-dependent dehydrogenase (short-subunit alcohol dehydrogenase family)
VAGDIADPSTARRVISEGVARFGRIDTLINNAGIFVAKPFTSYTADDYAAITAVNLAGFFRITQLAIAEMEKHSSGHVVSITTSMADHAIDGVPSVLPNARRQVRTRSAQFVSEHRMVARDRLGRIAEEPPHYPPRGGRH